MTGKKRVLLTLTCCLLSIKVGDLGDAVTDCDSEGNQAVCENVENERSCSICLEKSPCCNWCKEPNYTKNRCGTLRNLQEQNCTAHEILIGGASNFSILQNSELTDTDGNQEAVQIKPQKIKIKLREGESVTFSFKYRTAKNFPIQLYYLMDLTNSMKDHKESLVNIGKDLGELLSNLTEHHQLAFGYYADKVAMPFYKMTPADVQNPCAMLYGETCSKGFAFVHAQDFTSDIATFVAKVDQSNFTSNLDDLENGLEAIMQIVQCDEHVSWLKTSRKMIVMATNSLLHVAGEGVLAGVTKKHRGGCILSPDGILHDYLAYDYPSMEEVHRALEIKKVQLILASALKSGKDNNYPVYSEYYRSLHHLMPDVSEFVNDREIIENIKSGYEKITNKIYFTDNRNSDRHYLYITYSSSCNATVDTSAYCMDTNAGQEYQFDATVQLSKLSDANKKEDIILISESNIEENLELHIEYIINKQCDCKDNVQNDCSGHGSFKCGQCECHPTWHNRNCSKQCTVDNCRNITDTYTSTTCNSRGECNFDTCACDCDDDASGEYCEASNCAKNSMGVICSGNGACVEGACVCTREFSGELCECATAQHNCKNKNDTEVMCTGHGRCVCNKCTCMPEEETVIDVETRENRTQILTYMGDYCQYCLNCMHTCSKYKNCITANVENQLTEAYCDPNFPKQIQDKNREYLEACTGEYFNTRNQLCTVSFILEDNVIYYRDDGCSNARAAGMFVYMPLAIVIFGGLLAAGLWKGYTVQKDKRECARFDKEKGRSFQGESLLYKNPITTVQNPLYSEK